ncbi:MAG: hypothetical protein GW848_03160 [Rhodoferax sp.]|nr:hypothetical protein [Rhodoferax sp.]OIP19801.1 MAG: hypothetical protein AUK52_11740 [Comamonadaceae bacterium CG2_30_60_41]PIW09659.1 MAG: hypothetical protein COW39_03770 [Comamonadaceae bacterium CG17_big_fil_post_rev_8_21_14_2_50_60_13]PIY23075.1 MAG: hypothetical protein COZ10_10050 [Comamonadaceae bacterium CG_4_10_14_3_um_filter_60_75]PJC12267.1 MAG: hypothetical protein CO066_11300 [Comamonadaceae bacterium CG_4_9_14_0_8_um_filter_60_18]
MKQRLLTLIATVLVAASTAALAAPSAPLSTPELKATVASNGKPTLVFFLNPMGAPCQAQQAELDKLVPQQKSKFNLANVSVMDPGARQAFYDYGVRSLPSLVLIDKAGKISKVFAPGIQSAVAISSAVSALN